MPDRRNHRGAHPQDRLLFASDPAEPDLRRATSDLNWLLTRGYASVSALKLVGDRYALYARQRCRWFIYSEARQSFRKCNCPFSVPATIRFP